MALSFSAAWVIADVVIQTVDWAFTEHLLIANIISAGLLLALGDAVVQWMDIAWRGWQGWRFDFIRNKRVLSVGFILGVFNHLWYSLLDQILSDSDLPTVLKKIVLDQLIAGPFFSSAFIVGMCFLEGKAARQIFNEWRRMFPDIYKADWMFWPTAQFINFYLVPHKYRVFYVNMATLMWNTFLTYIKHRVNDVAVPTITPRATRQSNGHAEPHYSGSKKRRKSQGYRNRSMYFSMVRSLVAKNFIRKQIKYRMRSVKQSISSGSLSSSGKLSTSSFSRVNNFQTCTRYSICCIDQPQVTSTTNSYATPATTDNSKSLSLCGSPVMRRRSQVLCERSPVSQSSPVFCEGSPVLRDRSRVLRKVPPPSLEGSPRLRNRSPIRLTGSAPLTYQGSDPPFINAYSTSSTAETKVKTETPVDPKEINNLKSEVKQVHNTMLKCLNQLNKQNVQLNKMSSTVNKLWTEVRNSLTDVKNSSLASANISDRALIHYSEARPLSRLSVKQTNAGKTVDQKQLRTRSPQQLRQPFISDKKRQISLNRSPSPKIVRLTPSKQSIHQASNVNMLPIMRISSNVHQNGEKKKKKRKKTMSKAGIEQSQDCI